MSPFDRAHILFDFIINCASVSYRFRDIASYLSKVADHIPPVLGVPVRSDPGRISQRSLAPGN